MALRIRALTDEEKKTVERLAHSRTESARVVERARILCHASQGVRVPAIAERLHLSQATVRLWLKRFNTAGLAGLNDQPREGRPQTYRPEQVAEVIATSLQDPQSLGLPYGSWTLDRLEAYLNEHKGIGMKRSRMNDILLAEGLRWRKQESWFGERVDPDFAEKRGSSAGCTPSHRSEA